MNPDNHSQTQGQLAPASLLCIDDTMLEDSYRGLYIVLTGFPLVVGRHHSCDIYIPFPKISRKHARFYPQDDCWYVEDLRSSNGVFVNNTPVKKQVLHDGDEVIIGTIPFLFKQTNISKRHKEEFKKVEHWKDETLMELQDSLDSMMFDEVKQTSDQSSKKLPGTEDEIKLFAQLKTNDQFNNENNEFELLEKKIRDSQKTQRVGHLGYMAKRVKNKSTKKLIAIGSLAIVVVFIVGIFFYISKLSEFKTVSANESALNDFVESYEVSAVKQFDEPVEYQQLRKIAANIGFSRGLYPGSEDLAMLQAKVEFLLFERKFSQLIKYKRIDKLQQILNESKATILPLLNNTTKNTKNYRFIKDTIDLLMLGETVIKFKTFQQQYSQPSKVESKQPNYMQIEALNRDIEYFTKLHKKKDKFISKTFPFYNRLLEKEYKEFNFIAEWEQIYQE